MNLREHITNRGKFPAEALAKYEGKYVAWSPDGTAIVGSDEDEIRLVATIRASGLDPAEILISFVPPLDEVVVQ